MRSFSSRAGLAVVGTLVLLVAAWLSPRAIPVNMDELVHYHALGCATAPRSRELPLVRDGCRYDDLRLPLTQRFLPLRSYVYIGSLPSVPFYPFYRLLDGPAAARVQGAVFFLLFLGLASRLLRVRRSSVLLAALVYPVFLVTFVVDEGPVGLSALLLLGALRTLRRALAPGATRPAAWAALAGLLLFLGVWTKLVFAWWLPLAAGFAAAEALRHGGSWQDALRRHRRAVAAASVAFLAPSALLLSSVDREGRPYASVLAKGKVSAEAEQVQAAAGRLVPYLVDGARIAPRNTILPGWPVDPLPLLLAGGGLAAFLWRGRARRAEATAWAAAAAVTFALVSLSAYSQWAHHFAFPLLPLVLALALSADAAPSRARAAAAALVLVFWVSLGARLPEASVPVESSRAKDDLLRFVRAEGLDRTTLQLHATWGTYYVAQLFGDRERMLLYMRAAPDDPARLRTARDAALAHGRSVLLLSGRRWERLQTPAVEAILGTPRRRWRFGEWWAVEYAPAPGGGPLAGRGDTVTGRRPAWVD